ncbi:hypothetical protein CC86DRAFT_349711 [Ophiobolus disseminans]|uniref:Uncharacterized protein n=1 Tax=Ophiobolus disseminans TaxID=1469910 RepID=A0A6A7A062_9PLEO|nr:hypothetical protein CC86DRAFT_349711 [Ophiobolus disseminans]
MSEVDARFVKRGIWTNLDQGDIMGRTITTDTRSGIFVIAIMAVMSTIGTSHLWNLVLFAYHQFRATANPANGLIRQQQVILRTLPPPSSLMADSAKLWWSWRKRNDRVLARSLTQFLLATLCTAGFLVAGIFSSYVVETSDLEVLVSSPLCGRINRTLPTDAERIQIGDIHSLAVPYSQECYHNQSILPARCKAFVRPNIPINSEMVSCPFAADFCVGQKGGLPAVAIDSGLVDLNKGFGMNLPRKDGVKYRRRTTCSVLPIAGRTTVKNGSDLPRFLVNRDTFPGEQFVLLHYGNQTALPDWKNITVLFSLMNTEMSTIFSIRGYTYFAAQARRGLGKGFEPLAGMRPDDADVTVINLIAGVRYSKPVHDPWFRALKPRPVFDLTLRRNSTLYMADSPSSPMGCTIQHQFCIKTASGDQCSKLDSMPGEITSKDLNQASLVQLAALQLILEVTATTELSEVNEVRAAKSVQRDRLVPVQIPPDQWITEVKAMESYMWAKLQITMADYAIGPSVRNPDLDEYVLKPSTPADKQLCGTQKMRKAGGFVNVNVFGLTFVLATSLFLAILDIALLKFLVFHGAFRKVLSPRIDRWIQDGVLQLQRRAYEAEGQGTWSNVTKDVPLTEAREMLTALPLRSLSFPMSLRDDFSGTSKSEYIHVETTPSVIR